MAHELYVLQTLLLNLNEEKMKKGVDVHDPVSHLFVIVHLFISHFGKLLTFVCFFVASECGQDVTNKGCQM